MAFSSLFSKTVIPSFNAGREVMLSNIVANGGVSFQPGQSSTIFFHEYLSTLQIKNFYVHRLSVFETPLSAELDFCPGPAHQSLFSKTSKPMFRINIRCGPRLARTDITFCVEKLTHMRKTIEDAFTSEFQNIIKANDGLSYSWLSIR